MDARYKGVCIAFLALSSIAANSRSRNFVVTAPTNEIAIKVAQQAEVYRHKLAVEWLGKPLPDWRQPCQVQVTVGQIGAGGATTFVFTGTNVSDYIMKIQGPLDRILDSVLPHEVNHTIFAEHFRRPMPRWADEGAATFVEDESERRRQMLLAMQVLRTSRRIPLRSLLSIMDYPKDIQDVLNLYAEGYVLVELLIQNGGRAKFLAFLKAAHVEGWDRSLHRFYGHAGIDNLERDWNQWVLAGCPAKPTPDETLLAAEQPIPKKQSVEVARAQAPDREPVSVEDQAVLDDTEVALARKSAKRGTGLQAPPPARRQAAHEPRMISQVDLGPESGSQSRTRSSSPIVTADLKADANPTRTITATHVDIEEELHDRQPVVRASGTARPPHARPALRTKATPVLRLDSRTQYGQPAEFPHRDVYSPRGHD